MIKLLCFTCRPTPTSGQVKVSPNPVDETDWTKDDRRFCQFISVMVMMMMIFLALLLSVSLSRNYSFSIYDYTTLLSPLDNQRRLDRLLLLATFFSMSKLLASRSLTKLLTSLSIQVAKV